MQRLQNTPSMSGAGTGQRSDYSAAITQAKAQLAELQAQAAPTKAAFLAMSGTLRDQLGPAFDDVQRKAEKFNGANFDDFVKSLDSATRSAINNLQNLRSVFNEGLSSLQGMTGSFTKQAEDYGANNATKAYNEVRRRALAIYKTSAPESAKNEDIQRLVAEGAAAIKAGRALDALTASKKSNHSASQQAYESLRNSQEAQLVSLQQELDGSAKLSAAQRELNQMLAGGDKAFRALSGAQQADAIARQRSIVATTQAVKLQKEENDATQSAIVLKRQLAEMTQQQAQQNARQIEGVGHGQQWNEQRRGIEQIQDAYAQMRKQADRAYEADKRNGVDATVAEQKHAQAIGASILAEQQAMAQQQQFYADMTSAQGDWKNGAIAAMEDWRDAAANVSGQVADMVTNAANNMTDAFV